MGFYSWNTVDTDEEVMNIYSSHERSNQRVYVLAEDGNVYSGYYDGYGKLIDTVTPWIDDNEGLDYHSWEKRHLIIDFGLDPLYPELSFSYNRDCKWEEFDCSTYAPNQGYF